MTLPNAKVLYDVVEGTWPPASRRVVGPWTIREGLGAGSRVSAATANDPVTTADIFSAAAAMRDIGQPCLFMIRDSDGALDRLLESVGYIIKDPVNLRAVAAPDLARDRSPDLMTFEVWPPLAAQLDIWEAGHIGPERVAVMERAKGARTTILGRVGNAPAGTMYIAIHQGIAMFHALEVAQPYRKQGLARAMIRAAGHWAKNNGASHVACVVTSANTPANALYASLGFGLVGQYHYRIKPE
jgi:GNAT superfamily N-acetyltransferase